MPTHSIQTRYLTEEGIAADNTASVTNSGELTFTEAIPVTVATEIDLAFLYAKLKSLCLTATAALHIYTNTSDGSGGSSDTIELAAGQVFSWNVNDGHPNPITYNVTKIYAKNDSGTVTPTLKIRAIVDVTP